MRISRVRSAAAPITSRIPAAATTRPFRSTPTKPKGRRLARFEPFGFTPGDIRAAAAHGEPRFPAHARSAAPLRPRAMANAAPLFGEEALGRYDEMLDRSGAMRPHWQRLAASFAAMAPDEYRHRLESAMRMVRENGVTYNVYDEASGTRAAVAARHRAVRRQRRRLDARSKRRSRSARGSPTRSCSDIYGEQRLLRDGIVPPQLVLGHPQYLRALQGVSAAGRRARPPVFGRPGARERRFVDRAAQAAPTRRPAWGTRSKTASSSAKRSPSSSASWACSAWRRSSGIIATRSSASRAARAATRSC